MCAHWLAHLFCENSGLESWKPGNWTKAPYITSHAGAGAPSGGRATGGAGSVAPLSGPFVTHGCQAGEGGRKGSRVKCVSDTNMQRLLLLLQLRCVGYLIFPRHFYFFGFNPHTIRQHLMNRALFVCYIISFAEGNEGDKYSI